MAGTIGDDRVLDLIFDPSQQEIGLSAEGLSQDAPQAHQNGEEELSLNAEEALALAEAKRFELGGIEAAERGDLASALVHFDRAVEAAPTYASAYNNRAQGKRINGDVDGALADLNEAIRLSKSRGTAAEQAYVQRAMIRRLRSDNEGAWEDFKAAAALGSAFAKAEAVKLNPYAAMCNSMLREVIGKLQRGEE